MIAEAARSINTIMKTVSLPNRDATGHLTSLVLEALKAGATAALDPADPTGTLVLTFAKDAQAKAFEAKLAPAPAEPAPSDPVDKPGSVGWGNALEPEQHRHPYERQRGHAQQVD